MDKIQNKKAAFCLLGIFLLFAAAAAVYVERGGQKPEFIFMMNGIRSYDDFSMFQEFERVIREGGGTPEILEFEDMELSAIQQISALEKRVTKNTKCIVVNAASNENLAELLEQYRKKGIKVISCISEVNGQYRDLHIGAADPVVLGKELMEQAVGTCEGAGKFALLSESARTESATTLMMEIRYDFEQGKNPDMILSEVLYGNRDMENTCRSVMDYLKKTPDVKVLVCLSERMTEAACKAVTKLGMESATAVLGLGNPEQLSAYLKNEELRLKLYGYDMAEFGAWAAAVALAVSEGEITGRQGEEIEISGEAFRIQKDTTMTGQDGEGTVLYRYADYETEKSPAFSE